MFLELPADKLDIGIRISKAECCAMQRNQTSATRDVAEHGFFLALADGIDVGIDQQSIELLKSLVVESAVQIIAVFDVDTDGCERFLDGSIERGRLMMPFVSEHNDLGSIRR